VKTAGGHGPGGHGPGGHGSKRSNHGNSRISRYCERPFFDGGPWRHTMTRQFFKYGFFQNRFFFQVCKQHLQKQVFVDICEKHMVIVNKKLLVLLARRVVNHRQPVMVNN